MKKAFTIIEIIVAIGVLGIGVLGVAVFFANSAKISRLASNTSIATNLAQGVIDEQLAKSYDELTPGNGTNESISTDQTKSYYNFEKKVDINLIDSSLNTSVTDVGLKKIDVYVYWMEGNSEKNVQMSTITSEK